VHRLLSDLALDLETLTPQTISDITRTRLLLNTGGIWVDASVFPTRPLDEWLPAKITNTGFFAFERPSPDRPIASWFLAASSNNAMIRAWWEKLLDYWSTVREPIEGIPEDPVASVSTSGRFPYFWFHYLFQHLLESDARFAKAWASSGKLPADAPHAMQMHFASRLQLGPGEVTDLAALAPLHKLNWRAPYPLELLDAL
jgi:hypothetical protein